MDQKTSDIVKLIIVAAFLGGVAVGLSVGVCISRDAAISAGVAEYRLVDPTTGATEFRYITKEAK